MDFKNSSPLNLLSKTRSTTSPPEVMALPVINSEDYERCSDLSEIMSQELDPKVPSSSSPSHSSSSSSYFNVFIIIVLINLTF